MMSNLETTQNIYAAFGRGDVPFILSQLDENVVWEENNRDLGIPWIAPGRGLEAVQRFFGVVGQEFEIKEFGVNGLCVGENVVTALVHMQATIRSTGGRIDDHEVHVWYFNAKGKVSGFRHVVDTYQHLQAAGKL
ncbi:MAG: nuclear transport factor 2 family protein [Candidatus Sericytochromatia bacterium]